MAYNVLFLFADQHSARCLSCAGHPNVKTPNLDALAKEGTYFPNAYANNPICTPSRMSFLSGAYPATHGYYGLYGPEPQAPLYSMFAHFRKNGYRTGALGKLHTPRYWIERDCQFVYDEFIEFPKYAEGAGLYDQNDNRPFTDAKNGDPSKLPLEHSCEVALAKQAIRFMRNQGEPKDRGKQDAPWFAWVSFSRPHQPCTPSEPFASMYPAEDVFIPPYGGEKERTYRQRPKENPEGSVRKMVSAYLALVSQVDYGIGLILDELKRTGQYDNTIIVYSSDHGDYAGEHCLFEKCGGISYNAITRIPMIVRVPGQKPIVTNSIVEAVDLFPTLCDLTGTPKPACLMGSSFSDVIAGRKTAHRPNAFTENAFRKALFDGRYRYVANTGEEEDELYDLETDPWELHNLISSPEHREIAQRLLRTLFERAAFARQPVNTIEGSWHNHKYDENGLAVIQNIYNPYL